MGVSRKPRSKRMDFASQLTRMGFIELGDCSFVCGKIKVFRTSKTKVSNVRYWEVSDIVSRDVLFVSRHTSDILEHLSRTLILPEDSELKIIIKPDE